MQRRRFLAGTAAVGALFAGCTSSGGSGGNNTTDGDTSTDAANGTVTGTTSTDSGGGSYSVSIAPMGEVTFDSVPQTWVANNGSWADMGAALGVEPPKAVWLPERYHTQYYGEIPGVSVDKSGMTRLFSDGGVSKEIYYQLDGDIHVQDPNFLLNRAKGWKQADIDEIRQNIAPFFGNTIFSRGYSWHESYRYYSLYGAFEKLAKMFKREKRYEAFSKLHDEFQSTLSDVVPSKKSKHPSVAILWAEGNEPDEFSPYLIGKGTSFKQWRDLKVRDALAETDVENFHASRAHIDYETLLEIDPEVLLLRGHESQTAKQFQNTVVKFLKNHDVAGSLTAVKNGDVYRGGPLYQGPITNLVLTERAAKQVYPDAFSGVKLYDPQRVSDIVTGKF